MLFRGSFGGSFFRKMGLWIMLGEPWVTFGTFGDPWEVQERVLWDFRCFLEALGHTIFREKVLWAPCFSTYVYGIVPGLIFDGFWVLPGASRQGKSIEIHATVIKNQGSQDCGKGGSWMLPESVFY